MPAREDAPKINRSQLIGRVARRQPRLALRDVDDAVRLVFERVAAALGGDERVELRGFGSFHARRRAARLARNPRTGERVAVGDRRAVRFKPGRILRDRVQVPDVPPEAPPDASPDASPDSPPAASADTPADA